MIRYIDHKRDIQNGIIEAFVDNSSMALEEAMELVNLIDHGKIANIQINY